MEKKLEKIYSCLFNILDESGIISVVKKIKENKNSQTTKNDQITEDPQIVKTVTLGENKFEINLIKFDSIEEEFNKKKYPFLDFIIENVAENIDDYKNHSEGSEEEVYENCTELLSKLLKKYLDKNIMNTLSGTDNKVSKRWLEKLNDISLLKYEGKNISGRIVFCHEDIQDSVIDYKLKFKDKVNLKKARQIRKILEMSNENFFLVGDYEYIYGIGCFKNLEEINSKKIFAIDFKESRHYIMSQLYMGKDEIGYDINTSSQIIKLKIEQRLIANIKNLIPKAYETKYSKLNLESTLNNILKELDEHSIEDKRNEQIKKIRGIVEIAKEEKKGTMLVFLPAEDAIKEITNLRQSSIVLDTPIDISECIDKITSIDGAVLLDYDSKCYGVGVILDGLSQEKLGDPSRGARYNSAIKYIEKDNLVKKCLIIVISEDGMIDILPELNKDKQKEALNFIKKAIEVKKINKEKALEHYKEALVIYKEIDQKQSEGTVYYNIADLLKDEDKNKSKEYYEKALDIFKEIEEEWWEAVTSVEIGDLIENKEESRKYYEKALILFKKLGDKQKEADTYTNIANLIQNENKEEALECYEKALAIFKETEEEWSEASTFSDIAKLIENKEKAIEYYEKASAIFKKIEDKNNEAIEYNKIADLLKDEDKDKSKEYYEKSLTIFKETKEEWWEAMTFNDIGDLIENKEKAIEYYEKALPLFKKLKRKYYVASTYNRIARSTENKEKAIEYYEKSLPLFKEAEEEWWEAITYFSIANLIQNEDKEEAKEYYEKALAIFKKIGDKKNTAIIETLLKSSFE